jgi:hypothetical protein
VVVNVDNADVGNVGDQRTQIPVFRSPRGNLSKHSVAVQVSSLVLDVDGYFVEN